MSEFKNTSEKAIYNFIVNNCKDIIKANHGINMVGSSGSKECDFIFETANYVIVIELKTRKVSGSKWNDKYIRDCFSQALDDKILIEESKVYTKPILVLPLLATVGDEESRVDIKCSSHKLYLHRSIIGNVLKHGVYLTQINTFVHLISRYKSLELVIEVYNKLIFSGLELIPMNNVMDIINLNLNYNNAEIVVMVTLKQDEEFTIYDDGTSDVKYHDPLRIIVYTTPDRIVSFYSMDTKGVINEVNSIIGDSVFGEVVTLGESDKFNFFIFFGNTIIDTSSNKDIAIKTVSRSKSRLLDKYDKDGTGIKLNC